MQRRRPSVRLALPLACIALHAALARDPVPIEFYYEPGCEDCEQVNTLVLPELKARYADTYVLERLDAGITTNYLRLVAAQEHLDRRDNESVSMVVDGRYLLAGVEGIRTGLFATLDRCLVEAPPGTRPPAPLPAPDLVARMRGFTAGGVTVAGLIDSINPCAISTLVFFMSLLSAARIGGARLLLAGGSFVFACFVTYLAIGFGLLRILRVFIAHEALRTLLDLLVASLLLLLAFLSFRDAVRFARTGRPDAVALQLPGPWKQRIHDIMRRGLRSRNLLLGGLSIGFLVTLIESVCTGQVYVPTLVFVARQGESALLAAAYLLLYNLMFVLPMLVMLLLSWAGLRIPTLLEWSRRNVTISKTLMGLFFLAMVGLLLVL